MMRKNDHSIKMINYFNIPTLEEYVLVEQDICEVQVFRKSEHWKSTYYFLGDKFFFKSINVTLTVEDILEFLTSSQI
jgi:Uma2 family endonuclease